VGIAFPAEARAAMAHWLARDARRKRPAHRYTPESFGLEADRIREVFADYVARFLAPGDAARQEES
jgi:hypothetical protein